MKNVLILTVGVTIGLIGTMLILPHNKTAGTQTITLEMPLPVLTLKEQDGIMYSNDHLLRYTQNDIDCLTANIYYEAGNQPRIGKLTVGQVTLNRQSIKRFPHTICGVITAGKYKNGKIVRNKCAFSWYCDGLGDRPNLNNKIVHDTWSKSNEIAKAMLKGDIRLKTIATHYHTTRVEPYWINDHRMIKLNTVGDHMTYHEKS